MIYCDITSRTAPENTPFELRDLQKWLVKNNLEISERYVGSDSHTPYNSRSRSRIEGKFNDLIQLRLIKRSTEKKSQRIDSLYTERISYEYTRGGVFLALIIESINLKEIINTARTEDKAIEDKRNLERIHHDIYDCLVNSVFKVNENSLASNIFYSNLLKKCKDRDFFDKFVEFVHYIINNTNNDTASILNLFGRTVNFVFFNNEKSDATFTNILIETVQELEQNSHRRRL